MSNNKNKDDKDVDCNALSRVSKKCPPMQNITHPLRYYEFTPEEMKALEECDRESFYNRCLPFGTLFATLTYAGIKFGFLNPNPHFGVVPKMALAAALGHWYGRLSFIPQYDARLRKLPPNSHLGNIMRQYHDARNPKVTKK